MELPVTEKQVREEVWLVMATGISGPLRASRQSDNLFEVVCNEKNLVEGTPQDTLRRIRAVRAALDIIEGYVKEAK